MDSFDYKTYTLEHPRLSSVEILLMSLILISGTVLAMQMFDPQRTMGLVAFAGITFTLSTAILIFLSTSPDTIRARQSDAMLKLSRQTFAVVNKGLDNKSATRVCFLLLPATTADLIVITSNADVMGMADRFGYKLDEGMAQEALMETAQFVFDDNSSAIVYSPRDVDMSIFPLKLTAAIVVPLVLGRDTIGTLQFYYRANRRITETQLSIAEGFSALLTTQIAASALEEQTKLAKDMQLKALQNQINPHFLFNTINTIASLIRTDPMKARNLLREFALFYRQTLENSEDLILLSREAEQTYRYFTFEIARFGADRVELRMDEEEGVEDMLVPSLILQPIVENSVRHAMPAEGKLIVTIKARPLSETSLEIKITDNGVGMTQEACNNIMHPESSTGCGIAVKNVHDRIKGYFGPESEMVVESELGVGTTVTLILIRRADEDGSDDDLLDLGELE